MIHLNLIITGAVLGGNHTAHTFGLQPKIFLKARAALAPHLTHECREIDFAIEVVN